MTNPEAFDSVKVTGAADLLAAVAVNCGYHPAEQIGVAAFRRKRLLFVAVEALPTDGNPGRTRPPSLPLIVHLALQRGVSSVFIIGYGEAADVDPVAYTAIAMFDRSGIKVKDVLRVTGNRYFSLVCPDPRCCPPDGVELDLSTSAVTATAVHAGYVTLPSRAALVASIAAVSGAERAAMMAATGRAASRAFALTDAQGLDGMLRATAAAIKQAIARYRDGGRLHDDEMAWLTVHLLTEPARAMALGAVRPGEPWHEALWSDVTRRCDQQLAAAPAAFLAFAAWQNGNGALANIAVDRALDADGDFPFAKLMAQVIASGLPATDFQPESGTAGPGADGPAQGAR
jgi:uncharacterized protein DUF4192